MEQSDKIFGVPCTTSAMQSFSGVAASRFLSNPHAAVSSTTVVFGQSPTFPVSAVTGTSSATFPFATFNFSSPSFSSQSSTFSSISAAEPSDRRITKSQDSNVQLLFGKPVYNEPKKQLSEQDIKTAQTSQLEPKRRWNAKPGN